MIRKLYFAGSTGEWSVREIEPEEVFSSLGNWYVAGWDVTNDGERLFRADRIRSAQRSGSTFVARGISGAGRSLYTPTDSDVPARLLLRPGARWVAEYYATTDHLEREDGSLEVTLPSKRVDWVAALALRLGSDAEVLGPSELQERIRVVATETLGRYREA